MNERLSSRSQQLVRDALASETAPGTAKRAQIKRGVLAVAVLPGASAAAGMGMAKAAATAQASGSAGVVEAAGAAGTGTVKAVALKLLPWASAGSFGAKVTGATLIAIGAVAAGTQILPIGGGNVGSEEAATSAQSVSALKGFGSGHSADSAIGTPIEASPSVEVAPQSAEAERATSAGKLVKKRELPPEAANERSGRPTPEGPIAAKRSELRNESPLVSREQNVRNSSGEPPSGTEQSLATPRESGPPIVRAPKGEPAALAPLQGESERTSGAGYRLQNELSELEAVQAHLRSGRGAAALELLDSRDNKGALLKEERLASEVFAACQVGNVARARHAAQAFLARAPGSILAGRIRRSCAFGPPGQADSTKSRH